MDWYGRICTYISQRRAEQVNLSVMILTGGRSSRMKQDKALLEYGQDSFLGHLAGELFKDPDPAPADGMHVTITEIFLSAAGSGDYAELGLPVIADENQNIGPIEGIRRGLGYAREEYLFVCAVDMPFIKRDMALRLAQFISPDYDAYVLREGERVHPACGIYHRSVGTCAERMIMQGRYRLRDLLNEVRTRYVDIDKCHFRSETLQNINTPEDYETVFHTLPHSFL